MAGSLNLMEPSGSVQACNGIALHFFLILYYIGSGLVTLLKVIDIPIQVPNIYIFVLLVTSSSILTFRYAFSCL
jgi:hypothetical protein